MVRSALTVPEKAEDLAGIPGGCVAAVDQSDAGTHDGGAADARGGDRRAHPAGAASVRTMAGAGGAGSDLPWDRGGAFMSADRRAHQARRIDRVSPEIARKGGRRRYRAGQAEQAAPSRDRRPKGAKLVACPRLRRVKPNGPRHGAMAGGHWQDGGQRHDVRIRRERGRPLVNARADSDRRARDPWLGLAARSSAGCRWTIALDGRGDPARAVRPRRDHWRAVRRSQAAAGLTECHPRHLMPPQEDSQ